MIAKKKKLYNNLLFGRIGACCRRIDRFCHFIQTHSMWSLIRHKNLIFDKMRTEIGARNRYDMEEFRVIWM